MPTIKFVRVERDCRFNKTARAEAAAAGTTPRLTYDFDVLIDGEKRAQMRRDVLGRGYHVQDADGRPVCPPASHFRAGLEVGSKAEFLDVVSGLLDASKIPTMADLAAKRAEEAQAKADKIVAEKERMRLTAISTHSAAAYAALKKIVEAIGDGPAIGPILEARLVIVDVDAAIAEWMAAVDADPGRFGIY